MGPLPPEIRWVLWDLDVEDLDPERDADSVIARVLEYARLSDVRTLLDYYGRERIHRFFRDAASPIVSDRTRQFWRAYFHAEDEPWPSPPDWRKSSAAPWIG